MTELNIVKSTEKISNCDNIIDRKLLFNIINNYKFALLPENVMKNSKFYSAWKNLYPQFEIHDGDVNMGYKNWDLNNTMLSIDNFYIAVSALLYESKIFKIDESVKNIILNTDVDINKELEIPFDKIFIDCDIDVDENTYISGILLTKDFDRQGMTLVIINVVNKNSNIMFKKYDIEFFFRKKYEDEKYKKVMCFIQSFLKFVYYPEVEILYKEYSNIRLKRRAEEGKIVNNHYYLKITGKLREYIDLLDVQKFTSEYQKHTNSWVVRGYYRKLESDFWKNKKGLEIFIPPFIKGYGVLKEKSFLLSRNTIWQNEMQMILLVKKIFFNHVVLERTRGILDGLELDCYIPALKLAFEYNGKQHYEFVEYFHKTEDNLKEQIKRDKLKKELCRKLGIQLITIDYNEQINENLINNKLKELENVSKRISN